jgi:hypothetical protein
LSELTEYANRLHHDTNPAWETEVINDTELRRAGIGLCEAMTVCGLHGIRSGKRRPPGACAAPQRFIRWWDWRKCREVVPAQRLRDTLSSQVSFSRPAHLRLAAPDMPAAKRADYGEVVVKQRLRDALVRLKQIPFGVALRVFKSRWRPIWAGCLNSPSRSTKSKFLSVSILCFQPFPFNVSAAMP